MSRIKVSGWRKYSMPLLDQKKADVAILISESTGFKARKFTRDKEETLYNDERISFLRNHNSP